MDFYDILLAKKLSGGGGTDIHGVLKEYTVASGNSVSAGDFVTFVNNADFSGSSDHTLNSTAASRQVISATALSDNKVFIAYHVNDSGHCLKGLICTINGTSITAGQEFTLVEESDADLVISVAALSESKVMIVHTYANTYHLLALICTVDGTTITAGTEVDLATSSRVMSNIYALKLSANKIVIVHTYGLNTNLYGMLCTIDGYNITKVTHDDLTSSTQDGRVLSAVALSESKIFVAYNYSTQYNRLYGAVCTVDDTTITRVAKEQLISTAYMGKVISVVKLTENKVFVAHSAGENDYTLNGIVCIINGTKLTYGRDATLQELSHTADKISVAALNDKNVVVFHNDSQDYCLNSLKCSVNDMTITAGTDTTINSGEHTADTIFAMPFCEDKLLVLHNSDATNNYLKGIVGINPITTTLSKTDILGVAKTAAVNGEIPVYTLNA